MRYENVIDRRRRNRRTVYVATVVTAVATMALFTLPHLIPVAAAKRFVYELTGIWLSGANPFAHVRLFGGVVGGLVAGWLTADLVTGAIAGVEGALYGLGLAYLLTIVFYLVYFPLVAGVFPPPFLATFVVPIVNGIPLVGTHLVGGILAGGIAGVVAPAGGSNVHRD